MGSSPKISIELNSLKKFFTEFGFLSIDFCNCFTLYGWLLCTLDGTLFLFAPIDRFPIGTPFRLSPLIVRSFNNSFLKVIFGEWSILLHMITVSFHFVPIVAVFGTHKYLHFPTIETGFTLESWCMRLGFGEEVPSWDRHIHWRARHCLFPKCWVSALRVGDRGTLPRNRCHCIPTLEHWPLLLC